MIVKINSYEGKSYGSCIDSGLTFVEVDCIFPSTEIGLCADGQKLYELLKSLGLEVEYDYHPISN